jgi:GNAT superfamily N-acetyltransferase
MCGAGLGTDALVATENGVIIGHAMAAEVAGPDGCRMADIGLVVADRWQNRGVGSQMLSQVIALAAARGVGGLVMEVLPENRRMLAMITRRWTEARYEFGGGSVTVRVSLQAGDRGVGGAGRVGGAGEENCHGAALRAA